MLALPMYLGPGSGISAAEDMAGIVGRKGARRPAAELASTILELLERPTDITHDVHDATDDAKVCACFVCGPILDGHETGRRRCPLGEHPLRNGS